VAFGRFGKFLQAGFIPYSLLVVLLFVASAAKRLAVGITSLVVTISLFFDFTLPSGLGFVLFFRPFPSSHPLVDLFPRGGCARRWYPFEYVFV
jgi:hypothetical protein